MAYSLRNADLKWQALPLYHKGIAMTTYIKGQLISKANF